MGKWCAVPGCRIGSRTAEKRSVFRVPKDITTWKKWEQAIPGVVKLQQSDIVCEKHFNEEDVAREWVKFVANGRVIIRVSYKYPQLEKLAVPTKFHDGKENCEPSQLDSSSVVDQNNGSNGAMFSFPMKSPFQGFSVYADNNRVPLAVPNTGMSSSSMSVSSCDHLGDSPSLSQRASNAYSSFENRQRKVLNTYSFKFSCKEHASEILSYAIVYYIRLRMRQIAHQENLKQTKKFVVKKKLAKFTNE